MSNRVTKWVAGVCCALSLGLTVGCVGTPDGGGAPEETGKTAEASTSFVYSGRGQAVYGNILGVVGVIDAGDTGPLPPQGGQLRNTVLSLNLPPVLSSGTLSAVTTGDFGVASADASVENLSLNVLALSVSADVVASNGQVQCSNGAFSFETQSEIAKLKINGTPIVVDGTPNQTINLLVGKVIINEQSTSTNGNTGSFQANALHIEVPGVVDVVIAHSEASVTCD
jgi:hypothetical protein